MALTGWSASNYLTRAANVYDAYPFLVSVWTYLTVLNSERFAVSIGTSGGEDQMRMSVRTGGTSDNFYHVRYRDTVNQETSNVPVLIQNAWSHLLGEGLAINNYKILLNGGSEGTSAVSKTINASNNIRIGQRTDGGAPWEAAGALAEVSIWDATGMTAGDITSFAAKLYNGGAGGAGGNPLKITAEVGQPWSGMLKAYWLDSANTITDLSGHGNTLTMQGTLTNFASHPTIEALSTPLTFTGTDDWAS